MPKLTQFPDVGRHTAATPQRYPLNADVTEGHPMQTGEITEQVKRSPRLPHAEKAPDASRAAPESRTERPGTEESRRRAPKAPKPRHYGAGF
jgi:hypothetical protein